MHRTQKFCVGVSCTVASGFRGEQHGGTAVGGRVTGQHCAVLVIGGMLPGMLLPVCCKCILFVNFRTHMAVGFGADMIGGASVICAIGISSRGTLCSTLCSNARVTLCSGGGVYGTLCRLLGAGATIHEQGW
jgi:hypothetical protein